MSWVRLGVLMSLTLVATTLPASARSLCVPAAQAKQKLPTPAQESDTPHAPSVCPSSSNCNQENADDTTKPHPSEKNEPRSVLQIPLNIDVWHSGMTRTQNTGSGPALIQSLLGGDRGSVLVVADLCERRPIDSPRPQERSQRSWLTCRYAHAPPTFIQ